MNRILVKPLDMTNSDDWAKVYNQVMQRFPRFTPLSGKMVERIASYLKTQNVSFLIGYEKDRASAVCTYSIDEDYRLLRIYDFCVLPLNRYVGVTIVDQLLHLARKESCERVITWLPTSSTTSLDVLGDYLFIPGNATSLMSCLLVEHPVNQEVKVYKIDPDEASTTTLLPFHTPLQLQFLMESLISPWKLSYRMVSSEKSDDSVDIFLSKKLRRQAWIFHKNSENESINSHMLSSISSFLYGKGVREVYTEIESGTYWQSPYKDLGFERLSTQFELTFDIIQ